MKRVPAVLTASVAPLLALCWAVGRTPGIDPPGVRVMARTQVEMKDGGQWHANIMLGDSTPSSALIVHETAHALLGHLIYRDVPTAAAMEFCLEAGRIRYLPAREEYRRTLAEAAAWRRHLSDRAYTSRIFAAIDSLLAEHPIQGVETTASYLASGKLAALARSLRGNDGCFGLVFDLSFNAPARSAMRDRADSTYARWLWSANQLPLDIADETYVRRDQLDSSDVAAMLQVLKAREIWDSAGARVGRTAFLSVLARHDSLGFEQPLVAGPQVELIRGARDTLGRTFGFAAWAFDKVSIRVNTRLPGGGQEDVPPSVMSRLDSIAGTFGPGVTPNEIEVGTFPRNTLDDSTVTVQWSPAIANEAVVYMEVENSQMVGALATIHTGIHDLPSAVMGLFELIGRGKALSGLLPVGPPGVGPGEKGRGPPPSRTPRGGG